MMRFVLALLLALGLGLSLTAPVGAVQPDEILSDPVLEERARDLSRGLRCLVCRNESIDESHAGLARDLRLLVRERLVAGDSNSEVIDFVVDRYGEYVLLKPRTDGANLILWIAGPVMLVGALLISGIYLRRRQSSEESVVQTLSAEEADRLKKILEQ